MRVALRLLSALLGLALAALGASVAAEAAWMWARPAPLLVPWPQAVPALEELTWASPQALAAAGIVAGVGLALVLLALAARRSSVRLRDPENRVAASTTPRCLARVVGTFVRGQDHVDRATVTATPRKVIVRATTRFGAAHELRPRLGTGVDELLGELPLAKRPRVSVSVRTGKG